MVVLGPEKLACAGLDRKDSLPAFSVSSLLDLDPRLPLLEKVPAPVEEMALFSLRRSNTPVLIGPNDKSTACELRPKLSEDREGICAPIMDKNRSNVLRKPAGGSSVPSNPFLTLAF